MKTRITAIIAAVTALTAGFAIPAQASIVGSNSASCTPVSPTKGTFDYNVRGEQTYYRTANPNGKILAFKATPTFTIKRTGLPDITYTWLGADLRRSGNPTLHDGRSTGQFGSVGHELGPLATETVFRWKRTVTGLSTEYLECSLLTATQS